MTRGLWIGLILTVLVWCNGCASTEYSYRERLYGRSVEEGAVLREQRLTPELEDRILALNPDKVGEEDINNVLSQAPAPRIINIHGGWAVLGRIKHLFEKSKTQIRNVRSHEDAIEKEKFFNRRAEMYWNMRKAFEDGVISIPEDQDLVDELSSIRVDNSGFNRGKIKIIRKEKIKQELGHSPDKSDALAMTFCDRQNFRKPDDKPRENEYRTVFNPFPYEKRGKSWMTA